MSCEGACLLEYWWYHSADDTTLTIFLTEAQRRAFPDILIQIPAVNVSDPPYVLRYTSNDYLTNWRNYPCTWSLATEGQIYPMPRSCVGSDKFMVTWGFAASQHLGIPGHLIIGKDIYNRFMHSVDYENHVLGVAELWGAGETATTGE